MRWVNTAQFHGITDSVLQVFYNKHFFCNQKETFLKAV